MKNLFLTFCLLTLPTFAAFADEPVETPTMERPVDLDVDFTTSTFQAKPWVNEFHYVIVVNKADTGTESQSIKVYEYGKLIISGDVSTGRDQYEPAGAHKSKRDSWSVTPTGYYTPNFIDKNHKSSAYGGAFSWLVGGVKMPYAVFFNGDIALHQAPKGTEGALGTKASGGCIRLPEVIASDIFSRISETQNSRIPAFNVNGTPKLDSSGNQVYRDNAFSALIVVKNKIVN